MSVEILTGDCRRILATLPEASAHCCVTSPPYFGLRDYGHAGQIGLESTPDEYVAKLVEVFRAVRDRLADDGTLWLNLGDSYNAQPGQRKSTDKAGDKQVTNIGANGIGSRSVDGMKPKDLLGIPWRVAFALQADGWYLRSDIIWSKPNPMPESVTDRPTKAHEYLFLLSKSAKYHYDAAAIAEEAKGWNGSTFDGPRDLEVRPSTGRGPRKNEELGKRTYAGFNDRWDATESQSGAPETRNRRTVWTVPTSPYSGAHFATFPPALIEPCILAGCPEGGTVLDPFGGAGTTGLVADRLQRNALLIELNPEYAQMARDRITSDAPLFAEVV